MHINIIEKSNSSLKKPLSQVSIQMNDTMDCVLKRNQSCPPKSKGDGRDRNKCYQYMQCSMCDYGY